MVEETLLNVDRLLNVQLVHSSRGKIVRAEPISAMYEKGKVKHREPFNQLEDEMCIYKPGEKQSPNRMDAMVFSMSELMGEGLSILDAI